MCQLTQVESLATVLRHPEGLDSYRGLKTYILQLLHLARQNAHMFVVILALQLIQHSRTILAP
jgi:hypothetical protein